MVLTHCLTHPSGWKMKNLHLLCRGKPRAFFFWQRRGDMLNENNVVVCFFVDFFDIFDF